MEMRVLTGCVITLMCALAVRTVWAQGPPPPPPPGQWEPGPAPGIAITPSASVVLAGEKIEFIPPGSDLDEFVPGGSLGQDGVDSGAASWAATDGTPTIGSGPSFE